jgi:hypothetical protein
MVVLPPYEHVVVVVEENRDYGHVIGQTRSAPFINLLAAKGAVLSNFQALAHPSQPNYYALYAGSPFGVKDDNRHTEPGPTLASILQAAGLGFRGYVDVVGGTDFNHEPWSSFPEGRSVQTDFKAFPSLFPNGDYATLPAVSFVIPSLQHDMHDGTVQQADEWLRKNIGPYAKWAVSHKSLLVVVGDENEGSVPNRVPALLYGWRVVPRVHNRPSNHLSLLRTILNVFHLKAPRDAAKAALIADLAPTHAKAKKAVRSKWFPRLHYHGGHRIRPMNDHD